MGKYFSNKQPGGIRLILYENGQNVRIKYMDKIMRGQNRQSKLRINKFIRNNITHGQILDTEKLLMDKITYSQNYKKTKLHEDKITLNNIINHGQNCI